MKSEFYPPVYEGKEFHCPRCNVFAHQDWHNLAIHAFTGYQACPMKVSRCSHCDQLAYWFSGRMMVPSDAPVPPPHGDLPSDCVDDYNEARDIVARSPRAAAALLRLVIQKLMPTLGETGKNINDDIKSLVSKGLPVLIQRALDYCRVVGNNAVHPGELDLKDTPEVAHKLFQMINFIVEDRISRPKEIETLYNQLPENARKSIEERDKKNP